MSIESFIKKVAVQPVVYWGNPQPNGFGGMTFDEPEERFARWDDTAQLMRNQNGQEYVCKAKLLLTEDAEMGAYFMLGTLDDLESSSDIHPSNYPNAFMVGRFDKIPLIKSKTKFVRTAYLGYQQQGS